jgi:hypothetical protein
MTYEKIDRLLRLRSTELGPIGEPVHRRFAVDEFAATVLGLKAGEQAESKTFRYTPDPWKIVATDGTLLWQLSDIRTTYIRAPDPQTGTPVSYVTLIFNGAPQGWRPSSGAHLHQLSETSDRGLLEDWDTGVANPLVSTHFSFSKGFRPDFYDLANFPVLLLDGGTWIHI